MINKPMKNTYPKTVSKVYCTLFGLSVTLFGVGCTTLPSPAATAGPVANAAEVANTTNVAAPAAAIPKSQAAPAAPQPSAVTPAKGGYYLDDGPCPNPPQDLEQQAEISPKAEAYLTAPNRPYIALGQRYVPEVSDRPFRQSGKASWYGCKYHGQKTSSGELFDTFGSTAAHPTLPIPSYVRVTNLENQRTTVVRINDRGPFINNRIIDLSYAAALRLGILAKGTADVEIVRLFTPPAAPVEPSVTPVAAKPAPTEIAPPAPPIPPVVQPAPVLPAPPVVAVPSVAVAPPVAVVPAVPSTPQAVAPAVQRVYLQFGAFLEATRANAERERLVKALQPPRAISVLNHAGLNKVIMGPYQDRANAESDKAVLAKRGIVAFIVSY